MALINCTECGKEVSDQATACPQCGAKKFKPKPPKKPTSIATWLIGAVVLGGILISMVNAPTAPSSGTSSGPSKSSISIAGCQVEWERINKHNMKDPDSLEWDRHNTQFGMYKENIPVVIVPYRAKNGFGALTLEKATCKIDTGTGAVLSVL